ncbi:hypothetical protein Tco_0628624 [Tanacetum coccineum]|uniref:Uncharacterized protein n=1 Tax=Tanacetum coccineum TaxID=301880 RepID=A0ABQ4WQT2_9ASTR
MINAQQGIENLETTQEQVVEDAHVTISIVTNKTKVPATVPSCSSTWHRNSFNFSDNSSYYGRNCVFSPILLMRAASNLDCNLSVPKDIDKMKTFSGSDRGLRREDKQKMQNKHSQKRKIQHLALPKGTSLNRNLLESLFNQRELVSRLQTQNATRLRLSGILGDNEDEPAKETVLGRDLVQRNLRPTQEPTDLTGILLKGIRSNYAELEYDFKECYKALSEKLDWENPKGGDYPFDLSKPLPLISVENAKSDFPRLRINDIEDMLILMVQNRLTNLSGDDVADFTIALRMFTRSLVIQKRVKDLQLGVESYQKKINVTKLIIQANLRKRPPVIPPTKNLKAFIDVATSRGREYRHGVLTKENIEHIRKEKSSFHDQGHQQAAKGKEDDEEFCNTPIKSQCSGIPLWGATS